MVNNYWTRLSNISWFVSGDQINYLPKSNGQINGLRDTDKSRYFATTEFNNCLIKRLLRFDVILQHDRPFEQCLLHIRVFFSGKTKSPIFWSFYPLAYRTKNEHLPKPFFKVIRKSLDVKGIPSTSLEDSRNLSKLKQRKLRPNWVGHKNNRSNVKRRYK